MVDRLKYDVIIVGGGPAGSTAGYILSNFGLKVLIVDKKIFPRSKLCAGLITHRTYKLLIKIFGETEESLKNSNIFNFETNCYDVFYKDKLLGKRELNFPFYFVDRSFYDNFLLKKAQKAGAEIAQGENVLSIDLLENKVMTSNGKIWNSKYIIGADGANSVVRGSFPKKIIDKRKWRHNLATGLQILIDTADLKRKIKNTSIFYGFLNWGYSWVFLKNETIIVGLGGLNRKNKYNLLKSFQYFTNFLGIDHNKISNIKGHPIPFGNFILKPVYENTALVGDAAGLADPLTGEGIYYAQKSAELASFAIYESLYNKKDLKTSYISLLKKHFFWELVFKKNIRWPLFGFFNKSNYFFMKMLFLISYFLRKKAN